ncbi:MAG TPA: tetratricopeptide repeat protein [Polyangiaceae bacterium]|nr:tetratricopeptide repeat protein [Polyangiaceae bacterium]
MSEGPLRDPKLLEIESKLNTGSFDEAQRLLADVDSSAQGKLAAAYFSTRLLFQKGRLDRAAVIQRLRDLLGHGLHFPEAERMLLAAEAGTLRPEPDQFRRSTGVPSSPLPPRGASSKLTPPTASVRAGDAAVDELQARAASRADSTHTPPASAPARARSVAPAASVPATSRGAMAASAAPPDSAQAASEPFPQRIPRAPMVPHFTPRSGIPSYVPSERRATTPEPPVPSTPARRLPSIPSLDVPAPPAIPPSRFPLSERATGSRRPPPEGSRVSAETAIKSARALLSVGDKPRAAREIERLLGGYALEPPIRTSCARLLIESGRAERGLAEAHRAFAEAPDDPSTRLTCAWALVRVLRRTGDPSVADEVDDLLASTPLQDRLQDGNPSALLLSLYATLAAERGDASRAKSLAQSALQQDPQQVDALAALALALARLGHLEQAEQAQRRLQELDPEEAHANQIALARFQAQGLAAPPQSDSAVRAQLARLFGAEEANLSRGQTALVQRALETACIHRSAKLQRRTLPAAWAALGSSAAKLLTTLPLFRHFAPYDCSLYSVSRLDAALSLVYGGADNSEPPRSVLELLGSYVGESLRQAFGGEWHVPRPDPLAATVQAAGLSIHPFEQVQSRIQAAEPLPIPRLTRLHPGADPLGNSVPLSIAPPAPWDPDPFPDTATFQLLGRLLPHSVIGFYSEEIEQMPLDFSIASLSALDSYLALLAPENSIPDPDSAWSRRAAVLIGAYVGEVLARVHSAVLQAPREIAGLDAYRYRLPNGVSAAPVTRVLQRLDGRRASSLVEYVTRLAESRGS